MTTPDHFALFSEPVRGWVTFGTAACPDVPARLRELADAEGGPMFMDWPERWWDSFLRRCPNGHVSKTTLGTEKGDRCLACRAEVWMTFPEDQDGPLRVPVVPSWPCPTCGGSGIDYARGNGMGWKPCPDCDGEGHVYFGELTVGVAAHECPETKRKDGGHAWHFDGDDPYTICRWCFERRDALTGAVIGEPVPPVPAALTENITVQQTFQVGECSDGAEHVCLSAGAVLHHAALGQPFDDGETEHDITDDLPAIPKPGEWVGRIIERRALTEPITEYRCEVCGGSGEHVIGTTTVEEHGREGYRIVCGVHTSEGCGREGCAEGRCAACDYGDVPLPQGVGWYEADEALQAEIERRMP